MENPFTKFRVGQLLNARIIAKGGHSGNGAKRSRWELSIRPSLTAGKQYDSSGFVVSLSYVYICIFYSLSYITMHLQCVCIKALIYKGYKIVQEIYRQTFNWL